MTKDVMAETAALRALLSEIADHQILAEMLGFVADRLMALDVDQRCGAGTLERSTEWVNYLNGYRERSTYASMGNAGRDRRCSDPKASEGVILSGVSGAKPRLGKGDDSSDPGGLHSGCFHPLGR